MNVFCACLVKLCVRFFTVTKAIYLDMLNEWQMPQIKEDNNNFVLVQDGVVSHWHNQVRNYLDEQLPR